MLPIALMSMVSDGWATSTESAVNITSPDTGIGDAPTVPIPGGTPQGQPGDLPGPFAPVRKGPPESFVPTPGLDNTVPIVPQGTQMTVVVVGAAVCAIGLAALFVPGGQAPGAGLILAGGAALLLGTLALPTTDTAAYETIV